MSSDITPQLAYLKSVIEGVPNIEPWRAWFERNDEELQKALSRGKYLRLKLQRIKAIPEILADYGIEFVQSDRYEYLGGGVDGRCRDCGATVKRIGGRGGGAAWCPNGCFTMEWKGTRDSVVEGE